MEIAIDKNQYVVADTYGNVRFQHATSSNISHVLSLRYWQFYNFNDVLQTLHRFTKLTCYPLGKGVWFHKRGSVNTLIDNQRQVFFRFYDAGWKVYKDHAHNIIFSFLRDAGYTTAHHQPYARNASESTHRPRRRAQTLQRRKQTVSRTSRDVGYANENQRSKSTTLSRRQSANPRPHCEKGGGEHATRIHPTTTESGYDADVSSDDSDDYEYGSEPSVTLSD